MGEFDDLIEEFVAESKEHIADIEDDLIKLESDLADVNSEIINKMFRAAHSIKGSARFLDLTNIGDLAHRMEDVLNLIRSGKLTPDNTVSTALLHAADMIKNMLDNVTTSNDVDISGPLSELQKILDAQAGKAAGVKSSQRKTTGEDSLLASLGVPSELIREKLARSQVYIITFDTTKGDLEHFTSELNNLGEVLAQKTHQPNKLVTLFSTIMEPDMIPLALGVPEGSFVQVKESMLGQTPQGIPSGPVRQEKKPLPSKPAQPKGTGPAPAHATQETGCEAEDRTDEVASESAERIASLREEVKRSRGEDDTSFITFILDNEVYAVPIQTIEEIIGLQEISLLPNVPEFIKGVINLRGEIVPIMDLRIKFGLPPKEYTPFTVFVIVRVDDRLMGLVVDNVADVLVIDPSKVQKRPAFSAKISTEFINGVYKDAQDNLVVLMDVPSLIRPQEWEDSSLQAA